VCPAPARQRDEVAGSGESWRCSVQLLAYSISTRQYGLLTDHTTGYTCTAENIAAVIKCTSLVGHRIIIEWIQYFVFPPPPVPPSSPSPPNVQTANHISQILRPSLPALPLFKTIPSPQITHAVPQMFRAKLRNSTR